MLTKHIANNRPNQWLDWIESGIKKYEGRLNKGDWANLKIGDRIILYDDNGKRVIVEIFDLKYFTSFCDAFNSLGKYLVPIDNIGADNVVDLYRNYFSDGDIQEYGVVAVGVNPII